MKIRSYRVKPVDRAHAMLQIGEARQFERSIRMQVKLIPCDIPGPVIIEPQVHEDSRGFFLESWNAEAFREAGLDVGFVQDNQSRSRKGVLRGLHFQNPMAQGKLVRVVNGAVFDVVVDLRRSSPTFGRWIGVELSDQNRRMLWIPAGFAHGFLALRDGTDLLYKCTSPYAPEHEYTLAWNDPAVNIDWPFEGADLVISEKDARGLSLAEVPAFA